MRAHGKSSRTDNIIQFAVMMDVAAGVDKVATEKYIYRQGNAGTASYQASGTVYINSLNYNW